ncbi:hypothetical protein V5O48_019661, partial [Marasmius crinis-equi]
ALKQQHAEALLSSRSSLHDYLQLEHDEEDATDIYLSDEVAFCLAMESLYRAGMKRPNFKAGSPYLYV